MIIKVFIFKAYTYHTVFREVSEQAPVQVTLTNVPYPIVVILLFETYLRMQSYVCAQLFCSLFRLHQERQKSKLQNNHQQLRCCSVQCGKHLLVTKTSAMKKINTANHEGNSPVKWL